ncbi:DUF6457 domain-containing protein [Janibacter terrae]|uniref:DUF6457 domain-containing protein n=1 Tax=Janibacter terrae TaxID=103817 RepID=A0ABZ2FBB9_9MICO|nr:DUF6457 domain-containing protein [Janibacter terrae]MBA4085267.1 molybdopterin-guanine dinucleotide biosynthesis protein A [Kytococcus sp.]HBO53771.1 molybdopterin-guanine dinucleotide biosynthesis protein A [Janibacter terrae]
MTDLETTRALWADWIEDACAAVGIDPECVDVVTIHAMTKTIAHGFERPMAPVGAYILGVAVGHLQEQGRPVDVDSLSQALEATITDREQEEQA